MDYELPEGLRVKITKDVRERGHATGRKGRFVYYKKPDGWLLCTTNGEVEREYYDEVLPEGYIE